MISPKFRLCPKPKIVVNLSFRSISDIEQLVLAKGLNYALSPESIPKEGIIAEVESSIGALPSVIADQIRFETAKCLISAKPAHSNLILKNYTGKTPSHAINSTHFVELISEITMQPTDLLVTSFVTNIPIEDALNIMEQLLEQDNKSPDLARLFYKYLTSTYFVFQGKFFKQISGAAMRSPFSSECSPSSPLP
ncbi:hypothetical protein Trydic_g3904 [Trypoxylus dichotomus]